MTDTNGPSGEAYASEQPAYATPGDQAGEDVVVDGDVGAEDGEDAVNTEAVNDDPVRPTDRPDAAAVIDPQAAADADVHPDTKLAAERLEDLQRLQAEYVNYKKRVDRDRVVQAERAVDGVLTALMPVLDDLHAARAHGDLDDGPFAAIAEKLDQILAKFGFTSYGEVGEAFDPIVHEALMHAAWDGDNPDLPSDATSTTVVTVLQPGYKAGERVLRPARVAVADPE
ncbi:MAG: nucleotide exchange factor GrpE [Nostocoides sp.]